MKLTLASSDHHRRGNRESESVRLSIHVENHLLGNINLILRRQTKVHTRDNRSHLVLHSLNVALNSLCMHIRRGKHCINTKGIKHRRTRHINHFRIRMDSLDLMAIPIKMLLKGNLNIGKNNWSFLRLV